MRRRPRTLDSWPRSPRPDLRGARAEFAGGRCVPGRLHGRPADSCHPRRRDRGSGCRPPPGTRRPSRTPRSWSARAGTSPVWSASTRRASRSGRRRRCSRGSSPRRCRTAPRCCASRATSPRWSCPFAHAGRGIRLRTAPLAHLAEAITADTWLVAFSVVQSATGEVADAAAIRAAAARHGARTLCDATQAIGWLPVDAARLRRGDLPRVQMAVRAARCRLPRDQRGLRTAGSGDLRGLVRREPTRGRRATGERRSKLAARRARASTCRRPGRRSSAPSPRSSCSRSLDPAALHAHATGLADGASPRRMGLDPAAAAQRDRHAGPTSMAATWRG